MFSESHVHFISVLTASPKKMVGKTSPKNPPPRPKEA